MDWKVIAAVIVAAAIVVSGILSSTDVLKGFGGVSDTISSVFRGFQGNGNVSLSGSLVVNASSIVLENADRLSISADSINSQLTIGSEKINVSKANPATISIEKFTGKITIGLKERNVSLRGKAKSVLIDSVILNPSGKTVNVEIKDLNINKPEKFEEIAEQVKVLNTSFVSFGTGASGSLNIKDRASINLESDVIKIESYNGNFNYIEKKRFGGGPSARGEPGVDYPLKEFLENGISLSGIANKVVVTGKINAEFK